MKKLICLILALGMVFSLWGCGKDAGEGEKAPDGASEQAVKAQDWLDTQEEALFENFTMTYSAKFLEGYGTDGEVISETYALDGSRMSIDGEDARENPEMAGLIRNVMLKAALNIVADPDDFSYDPASGKYLAKGQIAYPFTVNLTDVSYNAAITVTDAVVTVDQYGHLQSIACRMEQKCSIQEEEIRYLLDVTFEFSNYGTTKP